MCLCKFSEVKKVLCIKITVKVLCHLWLIFVNILSLPLHRLLWTLYRIVYGVYSTSYQDKRTKWLGVHSRGKYRYAKFTDIYQKGKLKLGVAAEILGKKSTSTRSRKNWRLINFFALRLWQKLEIYESQGN